ncbi:protein NRT1/PTR FAMILY 7.1-like [Gossypium australe]|uniref:Protein NRT1/PTR FAMILY 7.1-like n=1 Tax=Gossypium australe TaxID=47621 RepID=A0A5B6W9M0_9ROSI|nr:protein NRT1/PTR FAMILY 7.1-like [Gossypium australe]
MEICKSLAGVNLVLFLTRVLDQDNSDAANNVSKWTGTVYLCSLMGAFLSDSYWGRYLTCTVFQLILVLGLGLLSFASWLFLINPADCGDGTKMCRHSSSVGVGIFYLSIYLIAFGYGGHQPTIATFGADQFDDSNPKAADSKAPFFCYFYFALNVGSLFSNTILVYYEDSGKWTLGFLVSIGCAIIALLFGNPLTRVAEVFVAAYRKWNVAPATADALYEVEGPESAIKGSRKIPHSDDFKFLDKAATITQYDLCGRKDPWRLCTVTQVEEVKCVLKMLPIWLCTIIYSVIFTQMASLFVEQGDVMTSKLGDFHLPACRLSTFAAFLFAPESIVKILVPLARRLSGSPKGLTELQRIGIRLEMGMMAMIAAGVTEIQRLKLVRPGEKKSCLSIFWQVPQYILVGASEVFMYVGQLEFFNGQAPDGIKSFGSSLCMASISLGNYVSSLLVSMVMGTTARDDSPGWIPGDLNQDHMDRFFFLVAALTALDFIIYVFCAKWYKCINLYTKGNHKEIQLEEQQN